MEVVSAGDIIDKTLIAKRKVSVYGAADDDAQPIGYVAAGQPVGVVYSYLNINPARNRSNFWWCFISGSGMWYYAKHNPDDFETSSLKAQGVLTVNEKLQKEENERELANMPWYERLFKNSIMPALGIVAAIVIVPKVLETVKKK